MNYYILKGSPDDGYYGQIFIAHGTSVQEVMDKFSKSPSDGSDYSQGLYLISVVDGVESEVLLVDKESLVDDESFNRVQHLLQPVDRNWHAVADMTVYRAIKRQITEEAREAYRIAGPHPMIDHGWYSVGQLHREDGPAVERH